MILAQIKGLLCVLVVVFLPIFAIGIDAAASSDVFAAYPHPLEFSKPEKGHIRNRNIYGVPAERGSNGKGESSNALAGHSLFRYELSQNEEGVESTDAKDEEADAGKEEDVMKESGPVGVSEPAQYCQGRFKRLGGTGVEIITVRCPKVDDSCNCEADKKSATKWIECGGVRKDSTVGADLLSCESKIVGTGRSADSE